MIKVIKNGTVITMDLTREEKYEKLDIVIKDDTIIDVCKNYNGVFDEVIDATGKFILPGLINCHTHLGMSIFRATNDNLDLTSWLNNKIWPIESNMNEDDVYKTSLLSCVEMIKTGTTTCNDMYIHYPGIYKALKKSKVRAIFPLYFIGKLDEKNKKDIQEQEKFYNEHKDDELIKFAVAPHGLYTTDKEYLIEWKKIADKYSLPIHMHFCENTNEVKTIKEIYNISPVEALMNIGYLNNKLILAHCTFITNEEIELLKGKDVSFVHNPVSNLNLGCGVADIVYYKNNGINVCLGTDGQGSGNNMNMFYHMSLVDFMQKGKYQDPTIFSSYETLKMATINGAKALGIENHVGSIEKGKKADIIILDLENTEIYPTIDVITQIVHNVESNNVDTTIINGEILMKNHKLLLQIDETNLKKEASDIMNRLTVGDK